MSALSSIAPVKVPRNPPAPERTAAPAASLRFSHYVARPILNAGPLLFATLVTGSIAFAWINREEGYITAEKGLGYWLGIAGGVLMLVLIAYPMRKRFPSLSKIGRVAHWFRLHMILGILGPALVVLHTNFKLGSLNSRLALFTMLIVVASGIVGRYLYAKVHRGLYGRQAELRDVLADIAALESTLGRVLAGDQRVAAELQAYAPAPGGKPRGPLAALSTSVMTCFSRRKIMGYAREHLAAVPRLSRSVRRQQLDEIERNLRIYFAAVKKAERLAFFERLFGMWHHLHMPLFILLALTVTLHILAVHRY